LSVPSPATPAPSLPGDRAARSRRNRRFASVPAILAALVGVVAVMGAPGTAVAAAPVSLTIATVTTPKDPTIGDEVFVNGTLRPAAAIDPTFLRVRLFINGAPATSTSVSNAKGALQFKIARTFTNKAGTLALRFVFEGNRLLAPAAANAVLKIAPAKITVTTVPSVAGVPISLGSAKAVTGSDGSAVLSIDQVGPADLTAHVDQVADPAIKVSFSRWGQGPQQYSETQRVTIQANAPVKYTLGLRTAYQASVNFVDENNQPIDPALITRVRFTSSTGLELVLTDFSSKAWWEAGTAVTRTGGLQGSDTLWRLAEVTMAGTNVVNSGQQSFIPTKDSRFTISLLLYDLTVRTNDALTGGAVGGTAELVYPDNSSKILPLDAKGSADFPSLPRGLYTVKLKIGGIAPPTPVALSRTQDATIRVISYVDIAAAVVLGLLVLIGLLWLGRRRLGWMRHLVAVPVGVARRVPMPRSARRPGAGARGAISATASDVARLGRGPGALAARFGRELVVGGARAAGRGARAVGRAASSPFRRPPSPPRETTPSWPTPQPQPLDGPMAAAPATNRPLVSRVATASSASRPVVYRVATTRPVTSSTAGSSWFDVPGDDEGPTHDCPRCGRAVPDSARFCRSCGHQQF